MVSGGMAEGAGAAAVGKCQIYPGLTLTTRSRTSWHRGAERAWDRLRLHREHHADGARTHDRRAVEVAPVPGDRTADDDPVPGAEGHVAGDVPVVVQARHRHVRRDEVRGDGGLPAEMLLEDRCGRESDGRVS